jgi:hypothetical protein
VGLNGIEIFDPLGQNITPTITKSKIQSEFKDAYKLFDNVIVTKDADHIWQTSLKKNISIAIEFQSLTKISLIRIWNYNKSRIYWEMGVKLLQVIFDNKIVTYPH